MSGPGKLKAKKAKLERLMKRSVLVHLAPGFLKTQILPKLKIISAGEGEQIPRADRPSSLFIVLSGRVGLFSGEHQIGLVDEGRALELGRVVEEAESWLYTWKALGPVEIVHFPGAILHRAFAEDKELSSYLRRMVGSRAIQRFKHDLNLIGFSPEETRATIVNLVALDNLKLSRNVPEDGLIIVNSGELEVAGPTSGRLYRAGDVFTLVGGECASVKPRAPGFCWLIERGDWEEVVDADLIRNAFDTLAAAGGLDADPADELHAVGPVEEDGEDLDESEEDDDEDAEDDDEHTDDEFAVDSTTAKRRTRLNDLPLIVQHDQMDCGAACLAMVLRFYGKRISVARLRGMLGVSIDGSSLADLDRVSGLVGLDSAAVEVELEGLADLRLPAISLMAHHFIVVYHVDEDYVLVSDPAIGRLRIEREEFQRSYSGISMLLKPNADFSSLKNETLRFWRYRVLLKGEEWELARAGVAVLFLFLLNLGYPLFMQLLFDDVLLNKNTSLLGVFLLGFAAISTVQVLTEMARDYLFLRFASKFDAKFTSLFLRHAMALPVSYFAIRRTGDFLSRLDELEKIRDFMSGKSFVLMVNLLSIAVFGFALYLFHPYFLAILFAGIPLYGFVVVKVSGHLQQLLDQRFISGARADSKYLEAITNLETVQTKNYSISSRWRWESEIVRGMDADRKAQYATTLSDGLLEILEYLFNFAILLTGVYLHGEGTLTVGQVVAVGAIGTQLLGPVLAVLREWKEISAIMVSFSKVDDIFSTRRENMRSISNQHQLQGGIELNGVSFRYGSEGSPAVLNGINLKIQQGEAIALVGPSGSGKSTLVNMLNMLYHPTEGEVLFDGRSAADLDLEHLRRQVAMIMQDNSIFTGSVLENIAFGDRQPSMKRAIEAAKLADAHGFISRLSKGYLHPLTPTPELSGGERQRICIARAFYLNPKILILDEATSALDSLSEQRIIRNLENGRGKMTTVTIAHRLDSIVRADRIIVMVKGRIVEDGSHRALMQKRGVYYQMFRKQLSA